MSPGEADGAGAPRAADGVVTDWLVRPSLLFTCASCGRATGKRKISVKVNDHSKVTNVPSVNLSY